MGIIMNIFGYPQVTRLKSHVKIPSISIKFPIYRRIKRLLVSKEMIAEKRLIGAYDLGVILLNDFWRD